MNACYIGVSGAGKTYQLKRLVAEYLSNGKDVYVIGRAEEWLFFSNINFFDVRKLNKDIIDTLLSVTNSVIIVDSTEFIEDKDFISRLAIKSRTSNNNLVVSSLDLDNLGTLVLSNVNEVYAGFCTQVLMLTLEYMFSLKLSTDLSCIKDKSFIKVM